MNTTSLVKKLKEAGEDFEFYPTTDEMLDCIKRKHHMVPNVHYHKEISVLDIGCGTCKFYHALAPHKYFVMEKSAIMLNQLPPEAIIVGSDFHQNTIIDKNVDAIFCNPPYSEYEQWVERILKEGNCDYIYLVIPRRWRNSERIRNAITKALGLDHTLRDEDIKTCSDCVRENGADVRPELRETFDPSTRSFHREVYDSVWVLGSFDFFDAERKARAVVDVIEIWKSRGSELDAFNEWFDESFPIKDKKDKDKTFEEEKNAIRNELAVGKNKIERLVSGYESKIMELEHAFRAITSLDADTLQAIGVSQKKVRESLKERIDGLKNLYWAVVFDEMEEITSRLTKSSREAMYRKFTETNRADFNAANIYAVVLYVIKNASAYYDEQLKDFFWNLTREENIENYKSNQRVFRNNWHGRLYESDGASHFCLCNRIIASHLFTQCAYDEKVDQWRAPDVVNDICVIARNLGFLIGERQVPSEFGKKYYIYLKKDNAPLMEFKVHKNGNTHIKFNVEFMKALNVEVGRLMGWVHNKADAAREFPDSMKGAEVYFKTNYTPLITNTQLLLN